MSPLAFLMAFLVGLMLWFGVGVVAVVGEAVNRLLSGRRHRRRKPHSEIPVGYGAFLPLAVGFGLLAGAIVGLVPQSKSVWLSCAAHAAAGMAYGVLLRSLARHGYLPFPEPS